MKKTSWAKGTVSTKAVRPNRATSRKEAGVVETHGGKGDCSYMKSVKQR